MTPGKNASAARQTHLPNAPFICWRVQTTPSASFGFTLIEMLATISILGLLVSLLLPATQAAREAARRTNCASNLKQIGLALLNFESVQKHFPIGARLSPVVGFGPAWWADILPQLEEGQLYQQLNLQVANAGAGTTILSPGNGQVITGVVIPVMRCPSSSIPVLSSAVGANGCLPSYTGIAGAANGDGLSGTPAQACCVPTMDGQISAGGVLVPNEPIRMADVIDGATHTLCVAEASDFAVDHLGRQRNVDGGYPNGWIMGTTGAGTPPDFRSILGPPGPPPAWNITTINYPPNTRTFELPGVSDNAHGPNNPLLSPHAGGVNGLLLDGSVHFIQETIDMLTLRRLATRNDGASATL
jgi:prepilin-type N-terminal cleavage/methylation domain-containing protein/prepilin-type processing-associated H-X9-DG protein